MQGGYALHMSGATADDQAGDTQETPVAGKPQGRKHRGRGKRVSEIQPPPRIRAGHRVFFHEHGEPLFGPGTFDLLVLVDETGSLHQAAKLMGMSYNKAWRAMRQAEDHLGLKLMTRRTGGSDGGGSVLTEDGYRLMERFRAFLDEADADLARLYQKYFGDASFAQPAEPSAGGKTDPSSEGR
jgi:molybdate transport system regulatory protein